MKRRSGYQTLLILAMLAGFFLLFFGNSTFSIRKNEQYVQQKADAVLPKTTHGITFDSAIIHLDNSIDIVLAISGHRLTRKFSMTIHAVGEPDFVHSKNGEVFFRPQKVEIVDFSFNGTPPGELLGHIRDRYVTNPGLKNLLSDAAPHVEDWMKDAAEDAAKVGLEHIPVYKVKDDWKGFFIGGALQSLTVQGNEIVATVSLWGITVGVILGILIVIVAIAVLIFIACNPEVGIALLLFD
jgi:hypothetical protein